MSILNDLEQLATGQRRANDLWGPPLNVRLLENKTGKIEPMGFATSEEYELSLTLVSRFWANRAQVQEARKVAERSLASLLYQDVLAKLSQVEHAIMDGDGRSAYTACSELRAMLQR